MISRGVAAADPLQQTGFKLSVAKYLAAVDDWRAVIADDSGRYFGGVLTKGSTTHASSRGDWDNSSRIGNEYQRRRRNTARV